MNFKRATPKQDSATPHVQNPPVWDNPELVKLAQSNDRVLAQATARLPRPMAKTKFQVARAWIRASYWISLALIFAVALLIRIASLAKQRLTEWQARRNMHHSQSTSDVPTKP
jgi:hypothetical protein